jgi:predicted DNA binding CopG/RHH family protein
MGKTVLYPGDPGFQYLDDEERKLITEIEAADNSPLEGKTLDDLRVELQEAARNTMAESERKTERMNIRMTRGDIIALKAVAVKEGLPYQSLVTSILHKYTAGRLVDIDEARKVLH